MAEASGGRTPRRRVDPPSAGFEDRDDHRTACASAGSLNATTNSRLRVRGPVFVFFSPHRESNNVNEILLTAEEVATTLRLSKRQVYQLAKESETPSQASGFA